MKVNLREDPQFLDSIWRRVKTRNVSLQFTNGSQFTSSTQLTNPDFQATQTLYFYYQNPDFYLHSLKTAHIVQNAVRKCPNEIRVKLPITKCILKSVVYHLRAQSKKCKSKDLLDKLALFTHHFSSVSIRCEVKPPLNMQLIWASHPKL